MGELRGRPVGVRERRAAQECEAEAPPSVLRRIPKSCVAPPLRREPQIPAFGFRSESRFAPPRCWREHCKEAGPWSALRSLSLRLLLSSRSLVAGCLDKTRVRHEVSRRKDVEWCRGRLRNPRVCLCAAPSFRPQILSRPGDQRRTLQINLSQGSYALGASPDARIKFKRARERTPPRRPRVDPTYEYRNWRGSVPPTASAPFRPQQRGRAP